MAVTSGANPWGDRGSYEAQEAFIQQYGYAVARRKAAEVDVVLPDPNPWGVERWSPAAQEAYIKKVGFAVAKRKAAEVGIRLPDPPKPPEPVILPYPVRSPIIEKPKVYIIRGRPGPAGKDGRDGAGTAAHPILGFTGEGPFLAGERFVLAPTPTAIKFPAALAALSRAVALFAPNADSSFVLTADPNEYLASGDGVICTVTFGAHSQIGAFIWGDPSVVAASTPLWVVAPIVGDTVLGGVQILFRGDPA